MTQRSGSRPVAATMDAIAGKEKDYLAGVILNHTRGRLAADRLARDGPLERALAKLAAEERSAISEDAVRAFLTEQRGRLRALAERNVANARTVEAFVAVAKAIRQQELTDSQVRPEEGEDFVDYEPLIRAAMEKHRADKASSELPMEQEKYCREIMEKLGEQTSSHKRKKGKDDDDIMVMEDQSGSSHSLKCPITMKLLEDPVCNKLCKHFYSKAAIENYIATKLKGRRPEHVHIGCPVPGCGNRNVSLDQLEEDPEAALLVRRFKRQEQRQTQSRHTSAENIDESDDE